MIEKPPAIWLPLKPAIIRAWKREDAKRATFPFPFFVPSAVAALPSLSYRTHAVDATDLTTYTFSTIDIGTAGSNRHVIVGVVARNGTANRTISSATIAGVSASIAADGSGGNTEAGILIAAVPTGTTGTISITFSAGQLRCGIAVWAAYDLTSATAFASLATSSTTLDINTPADGIIVAVSMGVSTTPVWSGITEVLPDTVMESTSEMTAASASLISAATPRAVSRSGAGTSPYAAIASFR